MEAPLTVQCPFLSSLNKFLGTVLWQPRFSGAFDIHGFASAKKLTKWAAAFDRGRAHVVLQCDSVQSLQRIFRVLRSQNQRAYYLGKRGTLMNTILRWLRWHIRYTCWKQTVCSSIDSFQLHQEFPMFLDWSPVIAMPCSWGLFPSSKIEISAMSWKRMPSISSCPAASCQVIQVEVWTDHNSTWTASWCVVICVAGFVCLLTARNRTTCHSPMGYCSLPINIIGTIHHILLWIP